MPDISVSDALILGGTIAAAIAALFGKKSGDQASKVKPLDPVASGVAAGFVDKDLMLRQTMATESIAATLKELVGIQTDEHERAVNDRLERIEAAVIKKRDDDERANRTGDRVEKTAERVTRRPPRD